MRLVFVFFRFGDKIRNNRAQLANEFVAGVTAEDFVEPTWVWFGILGRNYLDNVALF